jgi:hypothetical protein
MLVCYFITGHVQKLIGMTNLALDRPISVFEVAKINKIFKIPQQLNH